MLYPGIYTTIVECTCIYNNYIPVVYTYIPPAPIDSTLTALHIIYNIYYNRYIILTHYAIYINSTTSPATPSVPLTMRTRLTYARVLPYASQVLDRSSYCLTTRHRPRPRHIHPCPR